MCPSSLQRAHAGGVGILAFDVIPCKLLHCMRRAGFSPPKSRNLAVRRRYLDWPQVMMDHNHHC